MTSTSTHPAAPAPPELSTVLKQVRADALADRFALWGQSTVIDEHTRVASFARPLFDALHAAAGIQATFPIGNAGLIHVYGYWFSEVFTPFGYKFDRWRDGSLAHALDLPTHAFWIEGPGLEGTTALERVLEAVRPALETPPASTITADAELTFPAGSRQSRLVLRAPAGASASQPSALIYGVTQTTSSSATDHKSSKPEANPPAFQLITAFPFSGDPHALAADFKADPRPRWNAVVDS